MAASINSSSYDLICVGFGPASLSIAVALHDANIQSRVLFLERQSSFAWHEGMLLPGSHMQISYLKDMATFRDPRSNFTFLNYLHANNRLVSFTNQTTFYPLREEFNDYLGWCSAHFGEYVRYSEEVVAVTPDEEDAPVQSWTVESRNTATGKGSRFSARHVVVAVGGKPNIPPEFGGKQRVIHSSRYMCDMPGLLPQRDAPVRVAVVGGGQSAVEIYRDLHSRYPNSKTSLILRQPALKPSDDSPFVNEVFDPEQVDTFFSLPQSSRKSEICRNQSTNYSVVRLELIDALYADMYRQRMHDPNEANWQHHILPLREVVVVRDDNNKVELVLRRMRDGILEKLSDVDVVVLGTGYVRNTHETILAGVRHLLAEDEQEESGFQVDRSYRVLFREGAVSRNAGVWLQGCCESTHGLSDSLLSILAVRGGQIVDSIFGNSRQQSARPPVREQAQIMAKL